MKSIESIDKTAKSIGAFDSINYGVWMVAAQWWTHSPGRVTWSEGWQPSSAQYAFIKWTGSNLAMACLDDSTINVIWLLLLSLFLCYKILYYFCFQVCLQCFETIGWVLGVRKSICPVKTIWLMRCWHGYLSGTRCKWLACGPADATAIPSSLASLKSRLV